MNRWDRLRQRLAGLRLGLVALVVMALCPIGFADPPAVVRAVSVEALADRTVVRIDFDRAITARSFQLPAPSPRLVIDLPQVRFALSPAAPSQGEGPGGGMVRQFRYAAFSAETSRLVLDLTAPVRVQPRPNERGGTRLVFELRPLTAGPAPAAATQALTPVAARRNPAELIVPPPPPGAGLRPGRRTIVIDAGHGGRDPGAIGASGLREKDVVLWSALRLRDLLEARGRYHVVLTRDGDVYLSLEQRLRLARAAHADLFISLHADSAPNPRTQGASVYTLSETGGDRARRIMDREDWDMDLGDAPRTGLVGDILIDLAQRETTNRSARFAQTVISTFNGQVPLVTNTHRNAGFYVLLAPDVPAVLIELGFLTNAMDEARLGSATQRTQSMRLLAGAIDRYFAAEPVMAAVP